MSWLSPGRQCGRGMRNVNLSVNALRGLLIPTIIMPSTIVGWWKWAYPHFGKIHLHVWVSGVVPETIFGQNTPEMNELGSYLSNACLNFKIGPVVLKLQSVKVGNKIEKSKDFMRQNQWNLRFCVKETREADAKMGSWKKHKKELFWLIRKNYKELDILVENPYNIWTFQHAKKIFF